MKKMDHRQKMLRKARSTVTNIIRYDTSNHWPLFVSALNNTRRKRTTTVLEKHIGNTPNSCVLIQIKIVSLNIILINKFLQHT